MPQTLSLAPSSDSAPANSSLWESYHAGNDNARERLLDEHLGLVHHVARQIARTLSVRTDFDELVSAGTIGLMSALEGFDSGRGLAFSTFAAPRIRGAILDELRRQDHVPRSIRRKTRDISAARESFMRASGVSPDDQQLASQLGVDMPTLWRWQADVEGAHHIAIDRTPGEREHGTLSPAEMLATSEESDVEASLTHEQEVVHLREALLRLKDQERVVLSLYYFEELKLHEIAKVLELTESRVSQIRSKALGKLRVNLKPLRDHVA
ncbi:MAG TPA: FliA/WhiG family RNA polymerase sigma factor [Gemmatimonas sp.]|nr:FliA/WhiG family RNA polymerase sigma factor [Gemmatimonas sp.]